MSCSPGAQLSFSPGGEQLSCSPGDRSIDLSIYLSSFGLSSSSLNSSIKGLCVFFSSPVCLVSVHLCCDTCLLNGHQRHILLNTNFSFQLQLAACFQLVEFSPSAVGVLLTIKRKLTDLLNWKLETSQMDAALN